METIYLKKVERIENKKCIKLKIINILNKIKQILQIVKIKEEKENLIYIIPYSENLTQKQAKKIVNKLKQKNKEKIFVLSYNCIRDQSMMEEIKKQHLSYFDGKYLFILLIPKIIEYISEKQNKKIEEYNLSILINENIAQNLELIFNLALKVKSLNIITKNRNQFKVIENKLYNQYGIAINVTNNKKKSLLKSDIVINFDFNNEKLNQCNFARKQIIINIKENGKILAKSFDGININNYEINIEAEDKKWIMYEFSKDFSPKLVYENIVYKQNNYKSLIKQIEEDKVEINNLIGINTIISEEEFKKNII